MRKDAQRSLKVCCPHCGEWDSVVTDGRPHREGYRRKRRCIACQRAFFTLERPQIKLPTHNIS
jgi:transcriptional regulator NrdR family protein